MEEHKKQLLTILIPFYNEEEDLPKTLESLANQTDLKGNPVDKKLYQILLVDNNSTDNTRTAIENFKKKYEDLNVYVIEETIKSHIAARHTGSQYFLDESNGIRTKYFGSGDADVDFHSNWVDSVFRNFHDNSSDFLSYSGTYPLWFYKKVPELVRRYAEEVGTIFFDEPTIDFFNLRGKAYQFTEQVFADFIRPPTDSCFAMRTDVFEITGGFNQEFADKEKKIEVYGEGWRMLFKLEMEGLSTSYITDAPYNSSPRRLLQEPEKFLGFRSYRSGVMSDNRAERGDEYEYLNNLMKSFDLTPVKRYIIEYYFVLKCITRPFLIFKNKQYFGSFYKKFYDEIILWRSQNFSPTSKAVYDYASVLSDKYFDQLLESIPFQTVK